LQFDVQSFKVMMDDLAQAWRGETLAPLDITFRDYVMAEQARRQTPAWHDAGITGRKNCRNCLSARVAGG
jgi:yersiniabactin nonribosomal peptide/polyketide synthase